MEDQLDHPLFDTWLIIESRGIGKGKRYEITPKGLTIGRSAKADIIVLSSTVNEHHAVVEWDSLREEYLIRDLSTRNGTFVNQQPLRDTTKQIERGDSLRFGYDTDQVFRVEVLKGKPLEPPKVQNTSIQTTEDTIPHVTTPAISHVPSASPVHVLPVFNQTLVLPANQSPTHQGGILMAVNTVPTATVIATVSQIVTTPATPLSISTSTPSIATTAATQTKMSASESNKDLLRVRIDGRKSVNLGIKGSPLYGVPSWWGEGESEEETVKVSRSRPLLDDNEMPFSDSELIPKRPGTQILRNIGDSRIRHTHRPHPHMGVVSRSQEHLASDDMVESASNEENIPTSFTVEFEGPKKKRKPPGLSSQRPASYAGGLSHVEKASIPTDPRGDDVAMVTTPRRRSNRRPGTFTGKTVTKKSSSKPPSGNLALCRTSSPKHVVKKNKKEETFIVSESNTSIQEGVVISSGDLLLQSQSEIIRPCYQPMKSRSQPSSLQGTPYASSESGSRPGSARKQWIVENEIPHTLIMASVETRMRRLSEKARKTAENVRHVIEAARNEGLPVEGKSATDSVSSPSANSDMTLWKIVNKEYKSISKFIVEVERSLQDINDIVGGCSDAAEQVDYDPTEEIRIATDYLLVDSIEEERESSSEGDESGDDDDPRGVEEEVRIERNLDYDGDNDSSDEYYSASEPED